jgi:uncharacterized membrane protein
MTTTDQPQDRRTASAPTSDSPALRFTLVALLGVVGLGAVFGGLQMLVDPFRPMGMSTRMMTRTPFDSFVLPGVLLLVLVGVVPLVLAVGFLTPAHPHPAWSLAFGLGLMGWIATQWLLVDAALWLQPAVFAVGFLIAVVAALLWRTTTHSREKASTP